MDFEMTNRQKQIRLAAREFAEGELAGIGQECEIKEDFPRDLIRKAAQRELDHGFFDYRAGGRQ